MRQHLHVTNVWCTAGGCVLACGLRACVSTRVENRRSGAGPQVTQLKAAAAALSPMGATELEVGLYVTEQLLAAIEHAEAHLAAIDDDETVCLACPRPTTLYTRVRDVRVRRNVCGARVWRGMQIARSDVGRARAWCASFRRRRRRRRHCRTA